MTEEPNPQQSDDESTTDNVRSTATISVPYRVLGEIDEVDGIGVVGTSTSSGSVYGVEGRTDSGDFAAAGVRGQSPGAHGVRGTTSATNRNGVFGRATASTGFAHGVRGDTASRDGVGVFANSTATTGVTYGLFGAVNSSEGYGVYSSGDGYVSGDLTVEGTLPETMGGAEVYLGSDQSISSGTDVTVQFDQVETDQRNEFDTNSYEFVCAYDGNYHVDASVVWSNPGVDSYLSVDIAVNGTSVGNEYMRVGSDGFQSMSNSKTLFDLTQGDSISLIAWADSSQTVTGSTLEPRRYTTMTVNQVG